MKPRETPRIIPTTPRYFHVDTSVGRMDLRLPSYQRGAGLFKLLQSGREAEGQEGLDTLVSMLDVIGYAVGVCWCHASLDLDSGEPPEPTGDAWRVYGELVTDELQEHGLVLGDLMKILQAMIGKLAESMAIAGEAQAEGNG